MPPSWLQVLSSVRGSDRCSSQRRGTSNPVSTVRGVTCKSSSAHPLTDAQKASTPCSTCHSELSLAINITSPLHESLHMYMCRQHLAGCRCPVIKHGVLDGCIIAGQVDGLTGHVCSHVLGRRLGLVSAPPAKPNSLVTKVTQWFRPGLPVHLPACHFLIRPLQLPLRYSTPSSQALADVEEMSVF